MELLITVVTLAATIYAIVPRARQLDLKLRIGYVDWCVASVAFLAILYLEFNGFFSIKGLVFSRPWPPGITPQNTIYLVLLVAVGILAFRFRLTRLSLGKIEKFRELVEELYWDENYGELFTLLQNHHTELFAIARGNLFWYRLRAFLNRASGNFTVDQLTEMLSVGDPPKPRVASSWSRAILPAIRLAASWILRILPDRYLEQQTAQEILRAIVLSPKFVKALARTRPYFGLDIIRQSTRSFDRYEFMDLYLTELLRDPSSVFYQEIANNQNLLGMHRYALPESNRIIYFLLSNVGFAYQNNVYKPIGDYALKVLDELGRDSTNDPNNREMGDFHEIQLTSPLCVVISFFDIMVEEALHQGIEWHMWLYYLPPIVKRIVRNYRAADPWADADAEFPVRYSFILYRIFSTLIDWIEEIRNIPKGQPNITLASLRADHENGNIPKSSIIALCECSRYVLESDNLSDKFKNYLMDMVFTLYFELRVNPEYEGYATVLRSAMLQGGSYMRRDDPNYKRLLRAAFDQEKSEYSIKFDDKYINELEAALR